MSEYDPRIDLSTAGASGILDLLPPFPVVLVTTRTNVITIGQVEYFTLSPLRLGIAVAHSRHTYSLLKAEQQFVVNVPTPELLGAVKVCGSISGRDHDKFAAARLTCQDATDVEAVCLAECGAHIECRIQRELVFERRTWFIGEVVAARRRPEHRGSDCLLCGRRHYSIPGESVAAR